MKNLLMIAAIAALFLILNHQAFAQRQGGGGNSHVGQRGQRGAAQNGPAAQMPASRNATRQRGRQGDGQGQARGGPLQPGGSGQGDPETLFSRFDKNGDGFITPDEVPGNARRRVAHMDTNGDGAIDLSEFQAEMQNQQGPREKRPEGQGGGGAMFAQFDQNGDGVISPEEVPPNAMQRLAQMDTNNDGACDRTEMEAAMENQQGQRQRQEGEQRRQQQRGQGQQQRGQRQQGVPAQRGSGQFPGQRRPGAGGQPRGGGGQMRGGGGRGGNRR